MNYVQCCVHVCDTVRMLTQNDREELSHAGGQAPQGRLPWQHRDGNTSQMPITGRSLRNRSTGNEKHTEDDHKGRQPEKLVVVVSCCCCLLSSSQVLSQQPVEGPILC